ncbi:hypothetical protein LIT25_14300 [Bacillus sp. F19]|nr:hypothetical protein LIT25_14300 [Bacillus sp. F19]
MYPHYVARGYRSAGNRGPFFFGFGAPFVGGLLGGFLGSALFNYPRPYYYPPPPPAPFYGCCPGPGPGGYPGYPGYPGGPYKGGPY